MLISSTEPPELRAIGTSSQLPEKYGVDVFFQVRSKLVGVQRKEFGDLVASANDGRLNKELAQMQQLDHKLLVIEGEPKWNLDGNWMGQSLFSKERYHGVVLDAHLMGCGTALTNSLSETIGLILQFERHIQEKRIGGRPKPKSEWGRATNRDWGIYMLQGLGIGPKTAAGLYDKYGIPLQWTVGEKELMCVPGIGKHRAKKLIEALGME